MMRDFFLLMAFFWAGFSLAQSQDTVPDYLAHPENYGVVVEADGEYGYFNLKGERLFPGVFEDAYPFSEGLARVTLDGRYGYVNLKGEFVIPNTFLMASDFSDGLALAAKRKDGEYRYYMGYLEPSGEWAFEPEFVFAGDFKNGRALVHLSEVDAKILEKNGNLIDLGPLDRHYYSATLSERHIVYYTDSSLFMKKYPGKERLYGFINDRGVDVRLPEYVLMRDFKNGMSWVEHGGKCGVMDTTGKWVIPPKWPLGSHADLGDPDFFLWVNPITAYTNVYEVMNMDGETIFKAEMIRLVWIDDGLILADAILYPGEEEEGQYGYLDKHGQVVIPLEYEDIGAWSHGLVTADKGEDGAFILDRNNQIICTSKEHRFVGKVFLLKSH
ncbi:MAG: WG repeat-containing protein [Bacteroidota bacterium]